MKGLIIPDITAGMPCEDEYIKVPKKALKYKTAGMVAYNAEWLKDHFDIERAVICGAQQPCGDCVSRSEALSVFRPSGITEDVWKECDAYKKLTALPPVTPQKMEHCKNSRWIPITSRPMTEEEKELNKIQPDYRDDCRIFNCKLPDDGQEVLISVYGVVEIDTFVRDANDGCYFESRDIDEVDAWMPLPQSYKAASGGGANDQSTMRQMQERN